MDGSIKCLQTTLAAVAALADTLPDTMQAIYQEASDLKTSPYELADAQEYLRLATLWARIYDSIHETDVQYLCLRGTEYHDAKFSWAAEAEKGTRS
jgi:hypothetical protein